MMLYMLGKSSASLQIRSIVRDSRFGRPRFAIQGRNRYELQRRAFGGLPAVLLPPVVFGGLVIALWTWKCLMMVIFQNKIIFMPGLPPNARRETIEDYKSQCSGIQWKEEKTRSSDKTQISLCVASVDNGPKPTKTVYILYFQGNASSLPPRLPLLSPVLCALKNQPFEDKSVQYKMVCCSYRGYWTSKGRASEKGIAKDAKAALEWILQDYRTRNLPKTKHCQVVIWGQSIGAGVAVSLVIEPHPSKSLEIVTLILETPFSSIRSMLETLYPQKWLPYRYLWPFLRNHLDTWKALGQFVGSDKNPPNVLILQAGKDELVPASQSEDLERRCASLGINVRRYVIKGALHTEVMVRQEGRLAVVNTIYEVGQSDL